MTRLWLLVAVQASVSAASLVVEIVAGRMLAPYLGMSLYTWTSIIAVVLAGFSAGHWVGGRIAEWPPAQALRANGWAILAAALSTAGAVFILRATAGPVITAMPGPVASIVTLSMLVFFLPSFFAGIPAPILSMVAVSTHPGQGGRALGAMFAAGAWGAILGTLAAGFVFISWLGSVGTLVVVTGVYVVLGLLSLYWGRAHRVGMVVGLILPLALAGGALTRPDPCTRESDYFCIRVIDQPGAEGLTRLMVLDHLVHGVASEREPRAMLTGHGMMLDALPRLRMEGRSEWSAYLIGGGTYSVPRAWRDRGEPVAVTVAEIDPEVTRAAQDFFWYDPGTGEGADRIVASDARRLLAQEDRRYDVIIGDAFGDIAVPQHLITREFFQLAQARLNPGGVYVMNVIDHMDRLEVLSAMVRTAREVWPSVEVWTDPRHDQAENRRVFVLVAGQEPSPRTQVQEPWGHAIRIAASSIDEILSQRPVLVFTDDFAPIDRLLGDRGEG
ncbi:fused MFS/spermidine synthase [Cereibacter sphaeroides]|nr:fused MFS/spermidine synthase [Cereibacter sphaeroides]